MAKNFIITSFILGVIFTSCTMIYRMSDNQTSKGHYRLYTYPEKLPKSDKDKQKNTRRIVIAATNNLEGQLAPVSFSIPNRYQENRQLKIGGVSSLKSYLDILRANYKDQVLYVDSGSFLGSDKNHQETIFLLNYLDLDVAGLGQNELLINTTTYKNYIQKLFSKAQFDLISSNIFDLKEVKDINWKNIKQHSIKKVNDIEVGFISIATTEIAKEFNDDRVASIYIQKPITRILEQARVLRRKGADIIVLLANNGIDCTSEEANYYRLPALKVNFNPSSTRFCDKKSELYKTLEMLPPNSIDLVIGGGHKSKLANYINGIPVIQTPGVGQYISWVEIYFDNKLKTVLPKKTQMYQPVQTCHQFLEKTQDCYVLEDISNKEVIPAKFLGKEVKIAPIPIFK